MLDEAVRLGIHEELKALLQAVIDVVIWRQDPDDPKRGEALLQLFPLSEDFWLSASVNRGAASSWGCQTWLRRQDSNL